MASDAFAQTLERELYLELDPIKDATAYEIKIEPVNGTPGKPIIERIAKLEFAKKLPLGTYQIYARAFDTRNVPGRWNDLGKTEIQFKAPTAVAPSANQKLDLTDSKPLTVKFIWTAFHPKAKFNFVLKDSSGIDLISKIVEGENFQTILPAGRYTWQIRSNPPTGVTIQGEDPAPVAFEIAGRKLSDPKIVKPQKLPPEIISWREVPNATIYKIEITLVKDLTGKRIDPPTSVASTSAATNSFTMPKLDPGTYRFAVTAEANEYQSSRQRYIEFPIKPNATKDIKAPDIAATAEPPKVYRNLISASMGPVLWTYSFAASSSGDTFELSAATVTALSAELLHWFGSDRTKGWGIEIRGRQTNIYLFPEGNPDNETQTPVTVADRRIGLITRFRKSWGNLALDGLLGLGTHHHTYLIQDGNKKNVRPIEGELREFYLGASLDWTTESRHHSIFDLTFHPVSASQAMSVSQTQQSTATYKFLQNIAGERLYLTYSLENIRSSVTLTSDYFQGEATTISTWYRLGGGIAASF